MTPVRSSTLTQKASEDIGRWYFSSADVPDLGPGDQRFVFDEVRKYRKVGPGDPLAALRDLVAVFQRGHGEMVVQHPDADRIVVTMDGHRMDQLFPCDDPAEPEAGA
jgi:hypothetical protein